MPSLTLPRIVSAADLVEGRQYLVRSPQRWLVAKARSGPHAGLQLYENWQGIDSWESVGRWEDCEVYLLPKE